MLHAVRCLDSMLSATSASMRSAAPAERNGARHTHTQFVDAPVGCAVARPWSRRRHCRRITRCVRWRAPNEVLHCWMQVWDRGALHAGAVTARARQDANLLRPPRCAITGLVASNSLAPAQLDPRCLLATNYSATHFHGLHPCPSWTHCWPDFKLLGRPFCLPRCVIGTVSACVVGLAVRRRAL